MGHYDEYREQDAYEAREAERKRVAIAGEALLAKAMTMRSTRNMPFYVKNSIERLEASILLWMRSVGALRTHGD